MNSDFILFAILALAACVILAMLLMLTVWLIGTVKALIRWQRYRNPNR